MVVTGELRLPVVVQSRLTERHLRCSRPPPCSGTPEGWTRRGSARTLPQPPRCGTAGVSGTEGHKSKRNTVKVAGSFTCLRDLTPRGTLSVTVTMSERFVC